MTTKLIFDKILGVLDYYVELSVGFSCIFDMFVAYALLFSKWKLLPWETWVAFPKENQLLESRATQP